ncbi:alpha/beta hydrolase [Pajaroellobacter abortibovis]|nr:phospholipase [Pajaroellobacter abortibovis]
MIRRKFGPAQALLAGGTDHQGGGKGPICVLLHGFGADPYDLAPLASTLSLPNEVRWVFPEAPLPLESGFHSGRAWWMIDLGHLQTMLANHRGAELAQEVPNGLHEARAYLSQVLEAIEHDLHGHHSLLILGGFSQGAILSCDLAFCLDRRLSALIVLSGTIVAENEWEQGIARRMNLPIFQSHGDSDPILPFEGGVRLHQKMEQKHLKTTWCPFEGGHIIGPAVIIELKAFLEKMLSSSVQ